MILTTNFKFFYFFFVVMILTMPGRVFSITLTDEVVVRDSVQADLKSVVLIDDSSSMDNVTANGETRWQFYTRRIPDIFKYMQKSHLAMATINALTSKRTPELVINGKIDGSDSTGRINPVLSNAFNTLFSAGPHGSTPTRGAAALAGRFLMCQSGSGNQKLLNPDNPGTPCWNALDYRSPSNVNEQRCSRHSIWLFNDGTFRPNRTHNDPRTEDFLLDAGMMGRSITHAFDGITPISSTSGAEPSASLEDPAEQAASDTTGFSDVAQYLIWLARQGNFNFEMNLFIIDVDPVYVAPSVPYLGNTTVVPSLGLLEHLCRKYNGLPVGTDCAYPVQSSQWQWIPYNHRQGNVGFGVNSQANRVINFFGNSILSSAYDRVADQSCVTNKCKTFVSGTTTDLLLGLRHLEKAGMLGEVITNNSAAFEAAIPTLIENLKFSAVRASPSGVTLSGTESDDATELYQPFYHKTAGDLYRHTLTEHPSIEGLRTLTFNTHAANQMPAAYSPQKQVWSTATMGTRRPFKFPNNSAQMNTVNGKMNDWFNLPAVSVSDRARWILGDETVVGLRDRDPDPLMPVPGSAPPVGAKRFIGDIVNSKAVHVGTAFFKRRIRSKEAYKNVQNYEEFRNNVENRRNMLYVGSNDGHLHGFDSTSMRQLFAYIPSKKLLGMVTGQHVLQDIQQDDAHKFGVDLTPVVNDVAARFNCSGAMTPCWRTVLISGLRTGGRGYFALDITDPNVFSNVNRGANAILWEYGPGDLRAEELGFSYSEPAVVASHWKSGNDYKWVAAFGNGVNSPRGKAFLYVLAIDQGGSWDASDVVRIEMPGQQGLSDNGLLAVTAVDLDSDDLVDYYYAGDMYGNIYRIDVSSSNTLAWSARKLFDSQRRTTDFAISSEIVVSKRVDRDGVMVLFSDGHTYNLQALGDRQFKYIYGIWDEDPRRAPATLITPSDLVEQNYQYGMVNGNVLRGFSQSTPIPDYDASHKGWKVRLAGSRGTAYGERGTSLVYHQGALLATSVEFANIPPVTASTEPCEIPSPKGYLSTLHPVFGGARVSLYRFAGTGFDIDYDPNNSGVIYSSVEIKNAPSKIAMDRSGTAYTQDAEGNVKQFVIEVIPDESLVSRMSWSKLAQN